MTEHDEDRWETAELVAALDPGIALRLMAIHPETGYCQNCHTDAHCSMRTLAEAADRAARRQLAAPASDPGSTQSADALEALEAAAAFPAGPRGSSRRPPRCATRPRSTVRHARASKSAVLPVVDVHWARAVHRSSLLRAGVARSSPSQVCCWTLWSVVSCLA